MFGLNKTQPVTVYDPVVVAQAAHAMELFGASTALSPTLDQIEAVASVIGEAASIVQAMAQHSAVALSRGMIDASDPVIVHAVHDLNVVAWQPDVVEAAMHNVSPIPANPLAELFLQVTRKVMNATAKSTYPVTPTKALTDISAMPVQPTHVVVDPVAKP